MTHRYIARIVLEAETPLFVGSGDASFLKDALVQRDYHGFPMIQGTSLAGVLRHALGHENHKEDSIFGFQAQKGKKGSGSQVKISSAYLILDDNKIAEDISLTPDQEKKLPCFEDLPSRQHVRINDKGVADQENNGLFDNEVVYKGARFIFEIELKGSKNNEDDWKALLNKLALPSFRLGQGTRNGYGKLKIHSCKTKTFDLSQKSDFDAYLNYDPSFNSENNILKANELSESEEDILHYELSLKPDDFFIFSTGYGDDEVDYIPLTEKTITYPDNKIEISNEATVLPGSSIKGAISHRTAFHYNKIKGIVADNLDDSKKYVGANNEAVKKLFGEKAGENTGSIGKVIINDIFLDDANNDKIFNHVAIDRFTGGAIQGALFSEKVTTLNHETTDKKLTLNGYVQDKEIDENIIKALEESLKDICKGLLPLGGMTTKGHGAFTGKLLKNKKEIYNYE